MQKKLNTKEITLNYHKIIISTSLVSNFCMKEFPEIQGIKLLTSGISSLPNSKNCYNLFKRLKVDLRDLNFPKLVITADGFYYDIDYFINKILSKYNLNLSNNKLQEKLEIIKRN